MTFHRLTISVQKRGSRFYAYFYDPTRTPKRKSFALGDGFTTRRKAEQRATELLREAQEGRFDPWTYREQAARPSASSSLEGAVARFLEERPDLRPASLSSYKTALRGLVGLSPPGIGLAHVDDVLVGQYVAAGQVSPETRAHRYRHLRAFFNWAVETGALRRSPMEKMKPPRVGRKEAAFLTKDQFEQLRSAAEREEARGRSVGWLWRAVVVAVLTGMRRGELCHLRWGAVDLGPDGFVTVKNDATFQTKSGHERRVPMTEPLRAALLELRREQFASGAVDPSAFVLRGRRGGQLNAHAFTKAVKGLMKLAGLPGDLRLHSLRHTHASWLAMSGTSILAVSRLLGHSSTQVTQRYSHLTDASLRDPLERTFEGVGRMTTATNVEGRATDAKGRGPEVVPSEGSGKSGRGAGAKEGSGRVQAVHKGGGRLLRKRH